MQSNSKNILQYAGNVVVQLKHKNKLNTLHIHNQGTTNLGLFLAKALTGKFNKEDCPTWFNFEYQDSVSGRWIPLLRVIVPLTGATYFPVADPTTDLDVNDPTGTIGKVKVIATAQSSNTRVTAVGNSKLRLSLWDGKVSPTLLAEVSGDGAINDDLQLMYTALRSGQDAIVNWTMYITTTSSKE